MGKFAKWIGAGLGFATFGPIGAIIGFSIGSFLDKGGQDSNFNEGHPYSRPGAGSSTTTGGFAMTLLVLVAAIMKADGKVLRSELDYVKKYFVQSMGQESAAEAIRLLRDILKQDIPVQDVCRQIKQHMDHSSRLQLMHLLFGVSLADGELHPHELSTLKLIAANLNISNADFESIMAMFVPATDWAYKVLEIESTATNEEIKKAYKKMAIKYHPDKVSYLGEEFQESAKEKFQKVNEAYEALKKDRNIK
ncbi:molecular chaperone DjlA [Prolixibacteraceae bacterium JC049]|nr:molecular chaperone DjlA [Prolixibacteraceae bacterium JC049]